VGGGEEKEGGLRERAALPSLLPVCRTWLKSSSLAPMLAAISGARRGHAEEFSSAPQLSSASRPGGVSHGLARGQAWRRSRRPPCVVPCALRF
jgi:hypothetical protein